MEKRNSLTPRSPRIAPRSTSSGGFTLVEMLVAVGLTAVLFLMLGTVSVLLLRTQRRALLDVRVIDSARFATESIARTLRTTPPGTISGSVSDFQLQHQGRIGGLGCPTTPCAIHYFTQTFGANSVLMEQDGSAPALPLTSTALNVTSFSVTFAGLGTGDGVQPRATIVLQMNDPAAVGAQPLSMETTVSLRILEL